MAVSAQLLSQILRSLELHQLAGEQRCVAPALIEKRRAARHRFHELVNNADVPDEAVADFVRENSDCRSDRAIGLADIRRIRAIRRHANLHFSPNESADLVALLSLVFQLLHANTPASIWDNEFIVATDLTYRPHAEISPVAEKCYTILFGQYLLMDLMGVALTVYDVVEQVRETQDEQGFGEIVSSPAFLGMFNRSFHRRQFPYVLAALIEGERYRFSQTFSHLSGARHKAESFYIICVCFIVAHELAHFKNGDFGTGPSKYRNYYEEFFTKGSDLCVLDSEDEAAATAYLKNYAPRHCREIGADFEALRLTVNISIEVAKTRSVGIAAVSLVLGVLGWMDRASHYLVTGHDPAHVVGGRNYNRKTGYIDIRMPMENHPWGKTRCMTAAVHLLCLTAELDDGSQIELEHKIGTGILGLFAETIPEAMAIVGFVSNARGEFLAYYSSNADLSKIQTAYWPDILSSDGKTVFETAVDDLYGMREIMFVANGAEPDYGKAVKALAGLYGLKPPQSTD